jgi:DNA polymerase II small subunit/DNA polymerase delta subunit B
MTTATQTAAVQEPETSIHEPMETVSEHQRTLYRIKEAQRAERKAAKMKEKAIALAEQQAYDEEARREMQKRQEADRVAYIQLLSERADRTQKEYDELMSRMLMMRARAEELQNGIRNTFRAQYDTHQEDVYETANVAKVLHQVGALKLSSTGGTISIELSAGIGRRALSLDVNLRNYSMTISTNDGGLAVRPDGHGTVSVVRDRSPYMY